MAAENDGAVKIAVRERPMFRRTSENSESIVTYSAASKNIIIVNERPYEFDHCFGPNVGQKQLYDELVKPLVEKTLEGYFCSTLAYGQTGTGKTFTMGVHKLPPKQYGERLCNDLDGVIPRALVDVFELSGRMFGTEISVSFIEIYNEKVFDLLAESSSDPVQTKGFKFAGGVRKIITNADQGFKMLAQGNKCRHIRPTKMNAESSRSHAIFTIHVSRITGENRQIDSMLHLVDLAGSEGLRRTGHQGIAHTEGVNINKGLLAVGQVIRALVLKWKTPPYRESVLTSVLQDSLKTNSYLTLLVCISPLQEDLNETLYTLNFADNTKALKNMPLINSIMMDIKKNKIKTPYNSYKAPLSCNNSQTKTPNALKRAFTNADNGQLSAIKKPFHSNTFCTPNKTKKVDRKHLNQTDFGMTPKERMMRFGDANFKPIQLNLPLDGQSKQSLNGSIDSRSSLLSMNISTSTTLEEPVQTMRDPYSALCQTMRQELQSIVREELMKVYSSITGIPDQTVQKTIVTETCKNVSLILDENQDDAQPYAESSPIFKKPESPINSQANKPLLPANESMIPSNTHVDQTSDTIFFHSSKIGDDTMSNETVVPQQRRQSSRFSQNLQEIRPVRRSTRIERRSSTVISTEVINISDDDRRLSVIRKTPSSQRRQSLRRSIRIEERKFMMAIEEDVEVQFQIPKNTARKVPISNKTIAEYFGSQCEPARKKSKQECKNAQKTHEKAVLDLLNTGSIREIQILPQIGLKTAYQIVTQRTLNGKFKSFEQFSKLPIWRGTGWERFKKANSIS